MYKNMKTNKKQMRERKETFLKKIDSKYINANGDNIYPKLMTYEEFQRIITEYFLGENYYIADPISQGQANVIIAREIISNN